MSTDGLSGICDLGAVSLAEASKFCGLSRSYLYLQMKSGRLAYLKLGTARRIPRSALVLATRDSA